MPRLTLCSTLTALSPVPAGVSGGADTVDTVDTTVSTKPAATPGLVTDTLCGDLVFFSVMFVLAAVMTVTGTVIIARRHRRQRQREEADREGA